MNEMEKIACNLNELEVGHIFSLHEEKVAAILADLPAKQISSIWVTPPPLPSNFVISASHSSIPAAARSSQNELNVLP